MKIPELRSSLNGEYEKCREELKKIGRCAKSSPEVALGYRDSMIDHIQTKSKNTLASIKESSKVIAKRDFYTTRLDLLKLALDEMSYLKGDTPTRGCIVRHSSLTNLQVCSSCGFNFLM